MDSGRALVGRVARFSSLACHANWNKSSTSGMKRSRRLTAQQIGSVLYAVQVQHFQLRLKLGFYWPCCATSTKTSNWLDGRLEVAPRLEEEEEEEEENVR